MSETKTTWRVEYVTQTDGPVFPKSFDKHIDANAFAEHVLKVFGNRARIIRIETTETVEEER